MPARLRAARESALPGASAAVADALRRASAIEPLPPIAPALTSPGDIAAALSAGSPHAAEFVADVAESVRNLALSRAGAAEVWPEVTGNVFEWAAALPDPLVFFEQSIVDGHPKHPLKRTRRGMSDDEQLSYAPEHRPEVGLVWQRVPYDRQNGDGWTFTGDGHVLVPMHPWQHARLPASFGLPPALPETERARPLMSLRTFAMPRRPGVHVKTSIDVQMTSAVRRVSHAARHNGPILSSALPNRYGGRGFAVLRERASVAALDLDGAPSASLSALVRQMPALPAGQIALPLAALTAPTPHPRLFLAEAVAISGLRPDQWWARLTETLLPGPLRLAAEGIGLEAHGQNLLLVVEAGVPAGVLYRDFGGVRVHGGELARRLTGDIPTADLGEVHRTVIGSLFSVVLTDLAEAFGENHGIAPSRLWRAVSDVVGRLGLPRPLLDALYAETAPVKALTAMRLAEDQLEPVWAQVANPMAEHR
ncbi:IucA/IucC family protein [Phytomonospora sp. NPDC050363]|uniref:IucA/IucC family protein n=1 Tax=Phytomonospora sp. NPDC050363 TaxID=3155642 RepID=UPI0033FDCE71